MDPNSQPLSLTFELKIIKTRNILPKHAYRGLFVRCYLPVGDNDKRAKLESQLAIPSKSNSPTWDQTFSLHCLGTRDSIKWLKQGTIVFELRYRTNHRVLPFITKGSSKLLGRAEVPLKDVVESSGMDTEDKWVVMIPKNGSVVYGDMKPPAVQMAMKVIKEECKEVLELQRKERACATRLNDECSYNSCMAYEFFAIEACLGDF